jgi:hypothetical protein
MIFIFFYDYVFVFLGIKKIIKKNKKKTHLKKHENASKKNINFTINYHIFFIKEKTKNANHKFNHIKIIKKS